MNYHVPVLMEACVEALQLRDNGIYVDATLGGGGHSEAILLANPTIQLYGFDQDSEAIEFASKRLERFGERVHLIEDNYSRIRTRLAFHKIKHIDGVLYDLGVSTHQIDIPERGFSFQQQGMLDMRMNQKAGTPAYEIVNHYGYEQLAKIFREYGEEPDAGKVARVILHARDNHPIHTTEELAELLDTNFPQNPKYKIKMKARIFQALRIYVNQELDHLQKALKDSVDILNPGGRIAVISYHSLEDRIVKNYFREEEKACICPDNFPKCICGKKSRIKVISRKPITPEPNEILTNNRARSAKLRVAERKGDSCK
ncbi:MAG TPA: 16S rRNA (cytosine(1402)-N(4))-methyltransferase RsmH [Candidatus Cloacimonadota bacterium]|nr:16S rRNA (cytosine(1402)-N(4))-methyltransferase RsmH [Candidatus Cloacimonadota bacterium]HPT71969.1 16S rRNA (cytosine(1402)-N(4))-methyltransferase RsmH [Candidatus Cloacimonadota bacterium]